MSMINLSVGEEVWLKVTLKQVKLRNGCVNVDILIQLHVLSTSSLGLETQVSSAICYSSDYFSRHSLRGLNLGLGD